MILGIVGSEAAKFTATTERKARELICRVLQQVERVVSGSCHLGGIDVWAIEEARKLGVPTQEFPPRARNWTQGYKPRNIQIARASDRVICITVRELPQGYIGMRFADCYHCGTNQHVKSGGCWTVKYAFERLHKPGEVFVIS